MTTPASEGWHMPAEWQPHEATWLAWPHHRADWPGKFAPIPWVYAEIIRHLHTGEFVHLLVNDGPSEKRVRALLAKAGVDIQRVRFFHVPTDRVWMRDSGPIFLTRNSEPRPSGSGESPDAPPASRGAVKTIAMTDWRFNAWAKYDNWQRDDRVPARINARLRLPRWQPTCHGKRVVLEGGSIDVNGGGLLLTTEECLLSPIQARNPRLSKAEIEQTLGAYLGLAKILWLAQGIAGDDTHGHVDDLARFVGPGTVLMAAEENRADPNFEPLAENWRRLGEMTDMAGRRLEVVKLPMPAPVWFAGQRLPASYANFYIGNQKVLVPTFNDPRDRLALGILADLFPNREVVGIHAVDLVWGLGTLHCMTQQQPAGS